MCRVLLVTMRAGVPTMTRALRMSGCVVNAVAGPDLNVPNLTAVNRGAADPKARLASVAVPRWGLIGGSDGQ